jgi:hypothetical protein
MRGGIVSAPSVGGVALVLAAVSQAWAVDYVQVTSFSRSTTGSATARAGTQTNGPVPLSSSSTTWTPLAFGTIEQPVQSALTTCAPNSLFCQSAARVDQFIGITNPNTFQIASTVYGTTNAQVNACSTATAGGSAGTTGAWTLAFTVLQTTQLTLSRSNAAFTGSNSAGANSTVGYTITGPRGVVSSNTLSQTAPAGIQTLSTPETIVLLPGAYTVNVNLSAAMTSSASSAGSAGGSAYAGFNLGFAFGFSCDPIDFNNDGLFPDTTDIDDFLSVFSGGPCSSNDCNAIDFNNDGLFPDTADIDAILAAFSGGACP